MSLELIPTVAGICPEQLLLIVISGDHALVITDLLSVFRRLSARLADAVCT